jgi:PAS domain S-box-containing protein
MITIINSIKTNFITLFILLICSSVNFGAQTVKPDISIKQVYQKRLDNSVSCKRYIELANYYFERNDSAKFMNFVQAGLTLADSAKDKNCKAKGFRLLGMYNEKKGTYKKASFYYRQAIKISGEINDFSMLALLYNNLGSCYFSTGDYYNAIENFQKEIVIRESINDSTMSNALVYLGSMYSFLGKDSMALWYYNKALNLSKKTNNILIGAAAQINIGRLYISQGKYNEALDYFKKAYEIFSKTNDSIEIARIINNMGVAQRELGNYNDALQGHLKALRITKSRNFKKGEAFSYYCIGQVYYKTKQYNKAIYYLLQSLTLYQKHKIMPQTSSNLEKLSEVYAAKGDYVNAYKYHKIFKETADKFINEEKIKEISYLELNYKFENERKILALEQKRKDELAASEMKYLRNKQKSLFIGLTILILIIIILLVFYLINKKLNNELIKKNIEIVEQQKLIADQNEELQEHANALLKSNIKLEERQEKIRVQNEELERHRSELEEIVKERTAQLLKSIDKVEESEEKYRAIFENSGTALVFIEEDMTITMCNMEFEKLSGYSKTELEGKVKWTKFVAFPEDLNRTKGYHSQRRSDAVSTQQMYDFRLIDRNNQLKHIFVTVSVFPGTKQSLASLMDITELKNAEEKSTNLTRNLKNVFLKEPRSLKTQIKSSTLLPIRFLTTFVPLYGASMDLARCCLKAI